MDVECGIDASAFFRYLEEKHVLYGWGKSGVCAYGEAFVKKLKMYEHVIGEQARRLFPGIEYIAMPVEVPAEIARRTHLMQTMPTILLYPHGIEDSYFCSQKFNCQEDAVGCSGRKDCAATNVRSMLKHSTCLPLYRLLEDTIVEEDGRTFLVEGLCFRNEPESDPMTFHLREFHMTEVVFVGPESYCREGLKAAEDIMGEVASVLGEGYHRVLASDSFCPQLGDRISGFQKMTSAKHEYMFPVLEGGRFLACGSSNNHRNTFSKPFNIRLRDGGLASSSCFAFGLERLCFVDYAHEFARCIRADGVEGRCSTE